MTDDASFRAGQPAAWTFHRSSSRWTHNILEPAEARPQQPAKEEPLARLRPLPPPAALRASLEEVLAERVSCRSFSPDALTVEDISSVLHAGYGVIGRTDFNQIEFLERPVPSGGGLYPLEIYLLARRMHGLDAAVYHYVPLYHALEEVRDGLVPERLNTYLFMGQPYASTAAAIALITAVPGRSLWKYGERGYRYLLLEAGHVAQNLNLAGVALGLGCCNLGGFFDDEVAALLRVDTDEEIVLYGVALGRPASVDRDARRAVDR